MKKHLRTIFSILFSRAIIISGLLTIKTRYILKNNIPLALYFHNPDKKLLEDIIVWFKKKGFRFLSLQEFLDNIKNENKIRGAIYLSFDDGYEENITNVLPILNKYEVPATFFIPSKSIEEGFFWWDLVKGSSTNITPDIKRLWTIPNQERVKIISKIKKEKLSFPRRAITLQSLKNLSSNDLVTIGNHTDDHVICINCTNEELSREIKLCEEKLKKWVDEKYVNVFSFPNGDYNKRVTCVLKDNDIPAAFINDPVLISSETDMHLIPRMGVVDNICFSENLLHAVGVWQPIVQKLKKITGKA